MSDHSVLSPSGAPRRVRCAGSLAACKGVPNPATVYGAEGTAYHLVAATALLNNCDAASAWTDYIEPSTDGKHIAVDGFDIAITEDNLAHVNTYLEAVRRLPGTRMVEVRVDTSPVVGVPGQSGTADCLTLDFENATIHVDDLKFGQGVQVYCKLNEQLLEYAAAALEMYREFHDWQFIRVGIHQPRINHYDEHTYTLEEVETWVKYTRPVEQLAYRLWESGTPEEIYAELVPGPKQCQFCPIKGTCRKRTESIVEQFPTTPKVDLQMSDADIAAAYARVAEIESWCHDISVEALRRARTGAAMPGFKLVAGRKGDRKWFDAGTVEPVLVAALGDAAYQPRSIITPPAAEKLLKKAKPDFWETVNNQIVSEDGKLMLVSKDDRRAAVAAPGLVNFALDQSTDLV